VHSRLRKFASDFLRPHWLAFVWAVILSMLGIIAQLLLPVLSITVIDRAIPRHDLPLLWKTTAIFVCAVLLRQIVLLVNEMITLRVKEQIIQDIQSASIGHIQHMPLSFFSDKQSSYLQCRVMSDARALEGALIKSLISFGIDGLTLAAGLVFIAAINVRIGFLLGLFLIPFVSIRYYANGKMRSLSSNLQEKTARTSAVIAETFAGIRTLKGYVREQFQQRLIVEKLSDLRTIYVRTNQFGIFSGLGTSTVSGLCMPIVLFYGARAVINGTMTLGQVFAVISLLAFVYSPVNNLIASNLKVQQAFAALQRVYEILDLPQEQTEGRNTVKLQGRISLHDVSFAYFPDQPVLHNITLSIASGEMVALVGRSGSGKSTLANLLLGFYKPTTGVLAFDDHDIRTISLPNLRSQIGIVDQQPFLFSSTILDNIRIGNPSASEEEVAAVCRLSYADEFIDNFPHGVRTVVGEWGIRLSGGERQRIALARMFLKKPAILILDEAVSAVDSESERYIQEAVRCLMRSRTTVVIAHRLSSVLLADRIMVIEQGTIVEQGTHKELLARNGAYTSLFREQFSPSGEDTPSEVAGEVAVL
jgi:ABC-type multidrug transport system fused ATPase/permease subunit